MEVDIEQELDLKIPFKPFIDEISCPICFNAITNCMMTSCGHNFCSHCIIECINRNHKCPCCNATQNKENLVKNIHFDKIISILEKEKEISSKNYYEDLINQASNTGTTSNKSLNDGTNTTTTTTTSSDINISPVEDLFRKYLRKSILSFEGFYQELNKRYKDNVVKIEKENRDLVEKLPSNGVGNAIIIEQLERELELKKSILSHSFQESTDLLLRSLDDYLKQNAITPGFVTIYTSISIPDKNLVFDHVPLKPSHTVVDIKSMIVEKLNTRGGDYQFLQWASQDSSLVRFTVEFPASLKSADQPLLELTDHYRPISLYNIPAGSKIILSPGGITLKGDQPKDCFVTTYKPGVNDVMNYYRCDDCQFNWICKPCAEYCHKGHNLRIHIPNHKASFACCYDQRYKKCKILK